MGRSRDMNTVQNGKGDRPRNNWGPNWYAGYDAIVRRRQPRKQEPPTHREIHKCNRSPILSLPKSTVLNSGGKTGIHSGANENQDDRG
jgi:hypothetical protein